MRKWSSKVFLLLLAPLILFGACATPYQKESLFHNGYSDYQASEGRFVITFRASQHSSQEQVMKHTLRRAAEITMKHGYRYFSVIEEKNLTQKLHYPSYRIMIQCYDVPPEDKAFIDAPAFVAHSI
jgi:hypothetical protein